MNISHVLCSMILIFHPNVLYISNIEVAWKYIYDHICPIVCKPADLDVEIHIKKKNQCSW